MPARASTFNSLDAPMIAEALAGFDLKGGNFSLDETQALPLPVCKFCTLDEIGIKHVSDDVKLNKKIILGAKFFWTCKNFRFFFYRYLI